MIRPPSRRRSLIRNERGAVLTEFGLLIVPMCILLLGLLDLGYLMYLRSTFQGAINDVARLATVQNPTISGTGTVEQRMDAAIRERMRGLAINATYDVREQSVEDFTQIGKPEKLISDVNRNGRHDPGDCWIDLQQNGTFDTAPVRSGLGGADDVVLYTANLTMPRMFPMAKLLGASPNYEILVKATVRNQPYANQASSPTVCSAAS
jgi:Flp pilus assembly pilin Flp